MNQTSTEAIAVGNNAPRDVRLAAAMLIYLAGDVQMSAPKYPVQLSLTSYEEDFEAMTEICRLAAWHPEQFSHMQNTLRSVAATLVDWRYLDVHVRTRQEEAMENNEPTRWNVYTAPLKYRARLNPVAWTGYKPDYPPDYELGYMLRRVFGYQGGVQTWMNAS